MTMVVVDRRDLFVVGFLTAFGRSEPDLLLRYLGQMRTFISLTSATHTGGACTHRVFSVRLASLASHTRALLAGGARFWLTRGWAELSNPASKDAGHPCFQVQGT